MNSSLFAAWARHSIPNKWKRSRLYSTPAVRRERSLMKCAAVICGATGYSDTRKFAWRRVAHRFSTLPHAVARSLRMKQAQNNKCVAEGGTIMTDTIIGIDLGTTNSEVALIREGRPDVIAEDLARAARSGRPAIGAAGQQSRHHRAGLFQRRSAAGDARSRRTGGIGS